MLYLAPRGTSYQIVHPPAHENVQHTFALALQKSGYRNALMGKYLNGYQAADLMPAGWYEWDVAGNGYPELTSATRRLAPGTGCRRTRRRG